MSTIILEKVEIKEADFQLSKRNMVKGIMNFELGTSCKLAPAGSL